MIPYSGILEPTNFDKNTGRSLGCEWWIDGDVARRQKLDEVGGPDKRRRKKRRKGKGSTLSRSWTAWGFTYRSNLFVWAKPTTASSTDLADLAEAHWRIGLGYGTRKITELCLLGTAENQLGSLRPFRSS